MLWVTVSEHRSCGIKGPGMYRPGRLPGPRMMPNVKPQQYCEYDGDATVDYLLRHAWGTVALDHTVTSCSTKDAPCS